MAMVDCGIKATTTIAEAFISKAKKDSNSTNNKKKRI